MKKGEICNKVIRISTDSIKSAIRKAKLNFNYRLEPKDKIIAIDKETPFIVLIRNPERGFSWIIDFLLSEHVVDYHRIPKIKVSDYLKVARFV